jgi:hypothetical protein
MDCIGLLSVEWQLLFIYSYRLLYERMDSEQEVQIPVINFLIKPTKMENYRRGIGMPNSPWPSGLPSIGLEPYNATLSQNAHSALVFNCLSHLSPSGSSPFLIQVERKLRVLKR